MARNLDPVEASARARLVLHPTVAFVGLTAFVVVASLWSEGLVRLLDQVPLPWRVRAGSYAVYLLVAALASVLLLLVLAALRFPLVALA